MGSGKDFFLTHGNGTANLRDLGAAPPISVAEL